jgi:hypothetical protein
LQNYNKTQGSSSSNQGHQRHSGSHQHSGQGSQSNRTSGYQQKGSGNYAAGQVQQRYNNSSHRPATSNATPSVQGTEPQQPAAYASTMKPIATVPLNLQTLQYPVFGDAVPFKGGVIGRSHENATGARGTPAFFDTYRNAKTLIQQNASANISQVNRKWNHLISSQGHVLPDQCCWDLFHQNMAQSQFDVAVAILVEMAKDGRRLSGNSAQRGKVVVECAGLLTRVLALLVPLEISVDVDANPLNGVLTLKEDELLNRILIPMIESCIVLGIFDPATGSNASPPTSQTGDGENATVSDLLFLAAQASAATGYVGLLKQILGLTLQHLNDDNRDSAIGNALQTIDETLFVLVAGLRECRLSEGELYRYLLPSFSNGAGRVSPAGNDQTTALDWSKIVDGAMRMQLSEFSKAVQLFFGSADRVKKDGNQFLNTGVSTAGEFRERCLTLHSLEVRGLLLTEHFPDLDLLEQQLLGYAGSGQLSDSVLGAVLALLVGHPSVGSGPFVDETEVEGKRLKKRLSVAHSILTQCRDSIGPEVTAHWSRFLLRAQATGTSTFGLDAEQTRPQLTELFRPLLAKEGQELQMWTASLPSQQQQQDSTNAVPYDDSTLRAALNSVLEVGSILLQWDTIMILLQRLTSENMFHRSVVHPLTFSHVFHRASSPLTGSGEVALLAREHRTALY